MELNSAELKSQKIDPDLWLNKSVSEVCEPRREKVNPIEVSEVYVCIELEHLSQDTGRLLGASDTKNTKSLKSRFYKGDVLFGKLRPYLKKFLYAELDGVCSTEIWVLKAKEEILQKYLFYVVQSDAFIAVANLSTGTKMPRAEWKPVSELLIPLPPTKAEQEAIANALSDADAYIESLEQLIAKKRLIKKGVMQELLTGKRRLPGFSGEWKIRSISEICTFANGKPYEPHVKENGEYSLITLDSVSIDGKLKPKHKAVDFYDSSLLKNDIVIVLSDIAHARLLGLCDLIPSDNQFVLNQRMGRLRCIGDYDPAFVRLMINRNQEFFRTRGQGSSQKHIYKKDIFALEIPCPSKEEQIQISELETELDAEIGSFEAKLSKARLIKQGMMQELLTGRIRLV